MSMCAVSARVCAYTYICACVCVCVCLYACSRLCMCVCAWVCLRLSLYVRVCIPICVRAVCASVYMCIYVCYMKVFVHLRPCVLYFMRLFVFECFQRMQVCTLSVRLYVYTFYIHNWYYAYISLSFSGTFISIFHNWICDTRI